MTDCALAAPSTGLRRATRRVRRPLPHGIPRWTRLFGVTVVPLEPRDPHAPQAPQVWVISAGAGTGHIAALFHDGSDDGTSAH
jgi:hypothetical protein